jgi:hypothetical protein
MTDAAGLPALLKAIRHLEGCEAKWVESVPVHETSNGRLISTQGPQYRETHP